MTLKGVPVEGSSPATTPDPGVAADAADAADGFELEPFARDRIVRAREVLAAGADVVVYVLSGAGLSATAGLRTYRGPQGLYATGEMPPLHSSNAVPSRVHLIWEHLHGIIEAAADAASRPPSPAYQALADFQERLSARDPEGGYVIVGTQNIDGLHQHAGVQHVLELHGSVQRAVCLDRRCQSVAATRELEHDRAGVPRCPDCGARTRPDVVLFGESPYRMDQAGQISAVADVVLAVGTSLQVWPAASTVARGLDDATPGLWLDAEPDRAWRELPALARPYFQSLAQVAGDLNRTLPSVLRRLIA